MRILWLPIWEASSIWMWRRWPSWSGNWVIHGAVWCSLWCWIRNERHTWCIGEVRRGVRHKLRSWRHRWNAQLRLVRPWQHVEWDGDVRQWRWWRGLGRRWSAGIPFSRPVTDAPFILLHWPTLQTHIGRTYRHGMRQIDNVTGYQTSTKSKKDKGQLLVKSFTRLVSTYKKHI